MNTTRLLPLAHLGLLLTPLATAVAQEAPAASDVELLQAHYARVEAELRATEVEHLAPEQRAARARAIEALNEYRLRAEFGVNTRFPGARMPYFVDDEGRRCAVAWLLHRDGRDDIVERVHALDNHAYVSGLAADEELGRWLASSGLTLEEAARIQGPGGRPRLRPRPRTDPRGSYTGPGDRRTLPSGGSSSAPAPAGPAAPTPTGPAAAPASSGSSGPATPEITRHAVGAEAWWTWWELHQLDYLRPNLLEHWVETVTGYGAEGHPAQQLQRVRDELMPTLIELTRASEADLRASAAIALGRVGKEAAVESLIALLDDPSLFVRERAILALGATGVRAGSDALLTLARRGTLEEGGSEVAADARCVAVFALAVGRRNGFGKDVDFEIARIARESDRAPMNFQESLLLYQTLNPFPELAGWVLAKAADEDAPTPVRCRALETLRSRDDDAALEVLQRALAGSELELRRSAALALGELDHELSLPRLMTACELEREPLARGFVLISIGRRGGETARDFLANFLKEGRKASRAWAALGLGILARADDDDEARAALREALLREKNQGAIGAYHLALGIARDGQAEEIMRLALVDGATPEIRSVAAFGLAMIETEAGRAALNARLEEDSCSFTRTAISQALGYLGDGRDSERLLRSMRELKNPELQSASALALGLHGTRKSLEGLLAICTDEAAGVRTRAAALEAAQLILGAQPSLTVGELLRQANFSVFPATLIRLREVPL